MAPNGLVLSKGLKLSTSLGSTRASTTREEVCDGAVVVAEAGTLEGAEVVLEVGTEARPAAWT